MVALITDVHYRMSPALIRALAKSGVRIYTCEKEIYPHLPGARSKYVARHFTLPAEGYEDALYRLAEQLGQEHACKPALLPVGAATLQMLAKQAARFSKVAGLCIGTPEQIALFNSKRELHLLARELHIPTPADYTLENFSLPCVVKPICGEKFGLSAAERYRICRTKEEALSAWTHFEQLSGEKPVIQEYLPGGGSGCSVIAQGGKILAYIGHRRLREYPISGGPSSCCVAIDTPIEEAKKLIAATEFSGLAMFEFKEGADGKNRLLECNPRIWGSFPLTAVAESTLPFAWFAAAWNQGNPHQAVDLPKNHFIAGKKMTFFPSDLLAGLGYLKAGKPRLAFSAVLDFFNPSVKDGLFRLSDPKPAGEYYKDILHRGGKS